MLGTPPPSSHEINATQDWQVTLKRNLDNVSLDTVVSLCKRRGFIFPSSEIYGGIGSLYDYGPVGVELKRNVKDQWWKSMVRDREDVVGIDASILMHPNVWVASGHVDSFTDPLAECKECHRRHRSDLLEADECPDCGGELSDPRHFNLMFRTHIGPVEGDDNIVYLRPETAQAMFVDFDNVVNSSRVRIPFGIAQQGKSFRNEITPGNFTFRTREFEQMEMEYFCEPGTDEEWHRYWIDFSMVWFSELGLRRSKLRVREHEADELPHYSKGSADVEFLFPWGWGELETISNRTDYDLKAHIEKSGKDLSYYDQPNNKRYVPYVVEPAMGADRSALAFLVDAYDEEEVNNDKRVVLRFHPSIAPYQIAILPLSRNAKLTPKAREVYDIVRSRFSTQYDETQSIGRRYRRQDEIGTPLCVTVDFETVESDDAVTIRHRDTMEQIRVPIESLVNALQDQLDGIAADVLAE